jgi:anti-sigma factor RsiW
MPHLDEGTIHAWLDGALGADEAAALEAHVASCDACAAYYKRLKRTVRFVQTNSDVALTPGTAGATYAQFTRSLVDPSFERTQEEIRRKSGWITEDERRQGGA